MKLRQIRSRRAHATVSTDARLRRQTFRFYSGTQWLPHQVRAMQRMLRLAPRAPLEFNRIHWVGHDTPFKRSIAPDPADPSRAIVTEVYTRTP